MGLLWQCYSLHWAWTAYDTNKLNAFQCHIQNTVLKFDAIIKDVEKRVDEVNLRTTFCGENIYSRVSERFKDN